VRGLSYGFPYAVYFREKEELGGDMSKTARDIMDIHFHTLLPQTSIAEAVAVLKKTGEELKRQVFGMMVVDEQGHLAGMLSMYDILLLIRPKHIHIWGEMADIDVTGIVKEACLRAKPILVGDIMTTNVVTVTPDTHVLHIVDIMLKRHIRRLPVLEDGKIIGIVYLSKVFDYIAEQLTL
jgi:CBS domain-containing protein